MNKFILVPVLVLLSIAGGFFLYSKNANTEVSSQILDASPTTEIPTTVPVYEEGAIVEETEIDTTASSHSTSTQIIETPAVPETKAVIKSFIVKQNQDEKNLPIVFADLSWEVVGADSVSLDFLSCPEEVKIYFVDEYPLSDVCNKVVVLFNDSHQGTTTLLVMDTGLSQTSINKDLKIDIALSAENFSNNQLLYTTASQDEIHLGERQIGDIKAYPKLRDIDGAEATLKEYFNRVSAKDFDQALAYLSPENDRLSYIGAFDYTDKNPFTGIIDFFHHYLCESGYSCDVTISKIVHKEEKSDGLFEFTVSFKDKDGKQFSTPRAGCYDETIVCGSVTEYVYSVKKVGPGIFNIVEPITGPSVGQ